MFHPFTMNIITTSNRALIESTPMRKGLRVSSRVHRACNACRRCKMRCEGPIDGPCNRCQTTNQECTFDQPTKQQEAKRKPISQESFDAIVERVHALEYEMQMIKYILPRTGAQIKRAQDLLHMDAETPEEQFATTRTTTAAEAATAASEMISSSIDHSASCLPSNSTVYSTCLSPIFQPPTPIRTTNSSCFLPDYPAISFASLNSAPAPPSLSSTSSAVTATSSSSNFPSFDATYTSSSFFHQSDARATKNNSFSILDGNRNVQETVPSSLLPMMPSKVWSKDNLEKAMNMEIDQETEMIHSHNHPIHNNLHGQTDQSQRMIDNHTAASQASLLTTMAEVMEAVLQNTNTMNVQRLLNAETTTAAPIPPTIPSRTAPVMPPIQCETFEQATPCDSAVLFPPIYTSDGTNMLFKPMTTFQSESVDRQVMDFSNTSESTMQHPERIQFFSDGFFNDGNTIARFSRPPMAYHRMSNSLNGNLSRAPFYATTITSSSSSTKDHGHQIIMQPGTIITHQPFFPS